MNKFLLTVSVLVSLMGSATAEHWRPAQAPEECMNEENCAEIDKWYEKAIRPDAHDLSCCGKADAYWADIGYYKDGKYFVVITDDRKISGRFNLNGQHIEVLPNKIDNKHQGNPTGHTVIFITSGGVVLCFFPTTGI